MSRRAHELAERFEHVNDAFVTALEKLADEEWRTLVPSEERTVAALAHHVAWGYMVEVRAFRAMALGQPVESWTWETLDEANAANGREYAECDRDETVALLRREAAAAADFVRGLTDAQLTRSGTYVEGGPVRTVEEWIERPLLTHPGMHLATIRAALGR